jgi:lipopolysaccharide heptosyltransferase II
MSRHERILIFELNWMGDILFSFPFLKALRKAFPEAYLACVVVPRYAELLFHNVWVNNVHTLSDDRGLFALGEKISFASMIRKEKYDTCFFLKPSRTKALVASMAGIPERIGFAGKNASLTKVVEIPGGDTHRADQILALASAVDITKADGTYEYHLSDMDAARASDIRKKCGGGTRRVVAVNPGGNWLPKRWPEENYRGLIEKLLARFCDIEIMVTGSAGDTALAGGIAGGISDERCYTVAGKTTINELAALFSESALVVSADSGPLHLASATGAATIGIFGPTSPEITGQRGRGLNVVMRKDTACVIPCYVEECEKEYACMRDISVDDVFREAERILS